MEVPAEKFELLSYFKFSKAFFRAGILLSISVAEQAPTDARNQHKSSVPKAANGTNAMFASLMR